MRQQTDAAAGQAAFDRIGNDPVRWIAQGNDLVRASRLLRERTPFAGPQPPGPDFVRSMLLLRAFALECYVKAMWLLAGNKLAVAGKFEKIPGVHNHDLVALAGKVGLPLKPLEKGCLCRLTHFGVFGRYPINADWRAQAGKSFWSDADEEEWEAVRVRVDKRLRTMRTGSRRTSRCS